MHVPLYIESVCKSGGIGKSVLGSRIQERRPVGIDEEGVQEPLGMSIIKQWSQEAYYCMYFTCGNSSK